MTLGYYILNGKETVEVSNITAWVDWVIRLETADEVVEQTPVTENVMVSTVFLGLDHQFGKGPPLLFETLVFGGPRDGDQWRYSTWDEAEAGHKAVVDELAWGPLFRLVRWWRRAVAWLRKHWENRDADG